MIPYGLYVLTAREADGTVHAATINWVTQTSFSPPLVAPIEGRPDAAVLEMKDLGDKVFYGG